MTATHEGDVVRDEYGDAWDVFADDGKICAVQRGYEAGIFNRQIGELYRYDDGRTFGVNCSEEFVVRNGRWCDNDVG